MYRRLRGKSWREESTLEKWVYGRWWLDDCWRFSGRQFTFFVWWVGWARIASVYRLTMGWTVRGWNPGTVDIFRTRSKRLWVPSSLLHNGQRVSFPGVKRPGRGVDHPPPSNAKVKDSTAMPLLPHWGFMVCSRVNVQLFNFFCWVGGLVWVWKTFGFNFGDVRVITGKRKVNERKKNYLKMCYSHLIVLTHHETQQCSKSSTYVSRIRRTSSFRVIALVSAICW